MNARCPPLMIQQLPQAPGDLMRRHDDIFKACYGDELPVPGRVSDHHTALVANKILCRKRVKNDAANMMTHFLSMLGNVAGNGLRTSQAPPIDLPGFRLLRPPSLHSLANSSLGQHTPITGPLALTDGSNASQGFHN